LIRNVVDHESVVQKNRIKPLQRHRQTLLLLLSLLLRKREKIRFCTSALPAFRCYLLNVTWRRRCKWWQCYLAKHEVYTSECIHKLFWVKDAIGSTDNRTRPRRQSRPATLHGRAKLRTLESTHQESGADLESWERGRGLLSAAVSGNLKPIYRQNHMSLLIFTKINEKAHKPKKFEWKQHFITQV